MDNSHSNRSVTTPSTGKNADCLLMQIGRELPLLPDGNLIINRKAKQTYFLVNHEGERRSIKNDENMLYGLARKRYIIALQRCLDYESRQHRGAETETLSGPRKKLVRLLDKFEASGLDIARITMSPRQYAWMHAHYLTNPSHPEHLQYTANSGVKVRSKSERDIANQLSRHGIPYRYEEKVEVDVSPLGGIFGARGGRYKTYYPDFIILRPDGEKVIWEHFGLINLQDYRESAFEKAFVYRQLGLVSERNMIITFEEDLKDLHCLDDIIKRRIING